MVRYNEAQWMQRAAKRKAIRDKTRSAFAASVGVEPYHRAQDAAYAPQEQLLKVVRLMQVTRDAGLDPAQTDVVTEMAKHLARVGLGKGAMGAVSDFQTPIDDFHCGMLLDYFTIPYNLREKG